MKLRTALPLLVLLAACKKKPEPPPEPPPPPVVEVVKQAPAQPDLTPEPVKLIARNFERVHFEFDSTALTDDSMAALRENAKLLKDFPAVRVEIQGHADERGTTEYNLALGERRAKTLKDNLVGMGVSAGQLTLISYGEERPLATGGSETVWSKNRRAEFRVIAGDAAAVKGSVQ